MSRIFFKNEHLKPSILASLGLVVLILAGIALLASGPLFGLDILRDILGGGDRMDMRFRFLTVSMRLVALGSLFTFLGILHGRFSPRVRVSWRGYLAVILAIVIGWPAWQMLRQAQAAPALHDISTNLDDPPLFRTLSGRSYDLATDHSVNGGRLDPAYENRHRQAYGDIAPVSLDMSVRAATEKALKAATQEGWIIIFSDPALGRIEALKRSAWFGFESQISVRLRAKDAGAILDIRAISVTGVSDWGVNAALIRSFLNRLEN